MHGCVGGIETVSVSDSVSVSASVSGCVHHTSYLYYFNIHTNITGIPPPHLPPYGGAAGVAALFPPSHVSGRGMYI